MKHRKKVLKFSYGRDSKRALIRKLFLNFLGHGKITTTQHRAKFLKSYSEKLVNYAKKDSQSTKNLLQKKLNDKKAVKVLVDQVAPIFKEKKSGYVRLHRLTQRESDGALMSKLEWSLPVVLAESEKKESTVKTKVAEKKAAKKS